MAGRFAKVKQLRKLLADLDHTGEGGGLMGGLCDEAATAIRKQHAKIVQLKKMLTRARQRNTAIAHGPRTEETETISR